MKAIRVIANEVKAMPFGVKVIASLAIVGATVVFSPFKPAVVSTVEPIKTATVQPSLINVDHHVGEAKRKLGRFSQNVGMLNLEFEEYSAKHEYKKALAVVDKVIFETEVLIEDPDVAIAMNHDQDISDRIYAAKQTLVDLKLNRASFAQN